MRLFANLNHADYWNEHSKIPKPAGNKVRLCSSQKNYYQTSGNKERKSSCNFYEWETIVRMRIEHGKPSGP